jgi:beta-glucosidase-like glycosyl hydrolase
MGAITRKWSVAAAAQLAVAAGHDILLICEQFDNIKQTLAALTAREDLVPHLQLAWRRVVQQKRRICGQASV